MEIKDIIEGLRKARDKEKFIRDLIDKTKDKKSLDILKKEMFDSRKTLNNAKIYLH